MEKAGVSQSVAMKISGHKTDSVYRRYRVVDENDIERALANTQQSLRHAQASKAPPDLSAARRQRRASDPQ
jgi:hypothetical protein